MAVLSIQLPVILQGNTNLKKCLNLIVVIGLFTTSCALFRSEINTVSDLLPRDSDLTGWSRISPPAEYIGNRIRRYNEDYYKTGIERLSTCSYESLDHDLPVITVEVIRFNTVMDSYGLFSRIAAGTQFTPETENEYYGSNKAAVLRGEYLIYVFTESGRETNEKLLRSFINTSIKYIGSDYSRLKLNSRINILMFRDKYGIIYSIKPVDKLEGVDDLYYTLWHRNTKLIQVFISERKSFTDSYRLFSEKLKKGYVIAESGTIYTAFRRDIDGTYSFVSVNDKWIYGCWASPDLVTGKKITEELKTRISGYIPR